MTTIAFDGDLIACDSMETRGNLISSMDSDKIIEAYGYKCVIAGIKADCLVMLECFLNEIEPEQPLSASIIANHNDGRLIHIVYQDDRIIVEDIWSDKYFTLGSGGDFALAAMDFGKNAREAVKYASTRDNCTGGKIRSFKVRRPVLG